MTVMVIKYFICHITFGKFLISLAWDIHTMITSLSSDYKAILVITMKYGVLNLQYRIQNHFSVANTLLFLMCTLYSKYYHNINTKKSGEL